MQALMVAGPILGAIGSITAGRQAQAVGNRNAALLNEQAADTRRAGYDRELLARRRSASALSSQRAALAANGVDPTSGTALLGVQQGTVDAEMDALSLRYESLMQARGQSMQADLEQWQGRARKRQSYFSAAGQLLQAGANYGAGGFGGGSSSTVGTMARGSSSTVGMSY